tara:strand:+ start:6862 stop:6981 length:120 start_codon:yes stop_codon:yes gene_type:complete
MGVPAGMSKLEKVQKMMAMLAQSWRTIDQEKALGVTFGP